MLLAASYGTNAGLLVGNVVPRRARVLLGEVEQCSEPTRAALALRASLGARGEKVEWLEA